MEISVTSNIKEVAANFRELSEKGVNYATKNAINDVLFDLRKEFPQEIKSVFDKPVAFTTNPNAWEVQKAQAQRLVGEIKMRPLQAEYMRYQVYGGIEKPKKKAIPVPTAGGKMRAPHGGLKKSWKTGFGDPKFFVGVPKQKKGGGGKIKPIPGIYRRLGKNKKIRLEVSFEKQTEYNQKWDYQKTAEKVFRQRFNDAFRRRLEEQVARLKKV